MADVPELIDHTEIAQSRIPKKQREVTPFMKKIAWKNEKWRVFEKMVFGVLHGLTVEHAEDHVLELKGKQLSLERDGEDLEVFRTAILGRYEELKSVGTPEGLIRIVKTKMNAPKVIYAGADETGDLDNVMFVRMETHHNPALMPGIMASLRKAKQGGQGVAVIPLDSDHLAQDIHDFETIEETRQPLFLLLTNPNEPKERQLFPILAEFTDGDHLLPTLGEDYSNSVKRYLPHLYR